MSGYSVNAQVSAYSFAQSAGTYTPITGAILGVATGNTTTTNLNSEVYPLALPFNFNFNGALYNAVNVSTNGFVTFGSTLPSTTLTSPISSTTTYNGVISAFGRNISSVFNVAGVTGDISWTTTGTAPNREVIIQWKDFKPAYTTSSTNVYTFSFQIKLQETTNKIAVVYSSGSTLIGSVSSSSTAQVGLRGASNSDFNNRQNADTVEFFNSVAGTADDSVQEYSTVNTIPGMPTAGLTYTWTPPTCWRPTGLTNPNSKLNSVEIQWTAPLTVPSAGYEIYYSTSNTAPTSSTSPSIQGINTTSATIPSLNPTTTYFVWVRSVCSSTDKSEWSEVIIAKTLCAPMTSMFENFDSYTTGNIVPDCWARIVGASNTAQSISSTSPASGTRNILQTTSTAANATVVVLPEFSNVNAGTHWLRFKARVASATGSLDVGYVTNIADASTFVNVQTVNILNTSYAAQDSEYTIIVPASVPANARLAIRNNGISTIGHFWDDVYWEVKPSCIPPTDVTISNVTPTSATVQWTASVTPPANGYDVYYSTSNTAPTAGITPSITGVTTNSTIISPLIPTTSYYVWVRSRCSTTDFSSWTAQIVNFNTLCQAPAITGTTPATVCPGQTATLSATADTGATIKWYNDATAGIEVGSGSTFTTPALVNTTNYWVTASNASTSFVGPVNPNALLAGSSTSTSTSYYIQFEVTNSPITLISTDVFPGSIGQSSTIEILEGPTTFNVINSYSFTSTIASDGTTAQTVPINLILNPGVYRMRLIGGNYYRNYQSNAVFPYTVGNFSITTGSNVASNSYYFTYNLQISTTCESARTLVTATVDSNCLSTLEADAKEIVKVYPNPFSEVININKPELVKSIKITDVSGKLIRNVNQPESTLRLQDLSQGMYMLILEMKNGSQQSIKVIKK